MNNDAGHRLDQLLGYLDSDPDNTALIQDTIDAAISAGELDRADALCARLGTLQPQTIEATYFGGLVAMHRLDFARAADLMAPLLEREDHPNIRFNLAWSRAMLGDKDDALKLIDERTSTAIAAAAMLRVQLLHESGDFDGALVEGRQALERFPQDAGLLAAMSTLALDVEDLDLARRCVAGAGDHPEALAAAGVLELQDGDPEVARIRFDRSIALREHNPRAWIGRGLAALVQHDAARAAEDIDHGAQQFHDHIGSWIAAGWAHYLAGNIEAAHARFERAMMIDQTFAESHGSLAVIDITGGDLATARRRIRTAIGLDRNCFSAAFAQILLASDDPAQARTLVERAMTTPLSDSGLTIAGYMAGLTRPTLH